MSDDDGCPLLRSQCCGDPADQALKARISDLAGPFPRLSEAETEGILCIYNEYKKKLKEGHYMHRASICIDVVKGMCAAVVPILTGFGRTYKDVNFNKPANMTAAANSTVAAVVHVAGTLTAAENDALDDWHWPVVNLGVVLSIGGVMFSLTIAVLTVFMAVSGIKQNAQRDLLEASQTETELQTFLAGGGNYATLGINGPDEDGNTNGAGFLDDTDEDWVPQPGPLHDTNLRRKYQMFIVNYQAIRATSFASYVAQLQNNVKKTKKGNKNQDGTPKASDK
jgi:hypothetical protein